MTRSARNDRVLPRRPGRNRPVTDGCKVSASRVLSESGEPAMAMLLDTATVVPSDRDDAVDAAMRYATVPSRVTLEDAPSEIHSRMDLWDFGQASLLRQGGSGMRITRTAKELAVAAPERISLSLLSRGQLGVHAAGLLADRRSARAELVLTDLSATTDYNRIGEGGLALFPGGHGQLTMPVDVVRSAAPRLTGPARCTSWCATTSRSSTVSSTRSTGRRGRWSARQPSSWSGHWSPAPRGDVPGSEAIDRTRCRPGSRCTSSGTSPIPTSAPPGSPARTTSRCATCTTRGPPAT